ncbi:PepSY domain-containing protein [Lagierella sp.]|uniref:PepSY domain-containing protein n=1 Tax=Lagierella sp. TaxID=2849657 RepID=UPI00260B766E|nr:PepSY domain-containing protein [Lagierella sp.]
MKKLLLGTLMIGSLLLVGCDQGNKPGENEAQPTHPTETLGPSETMPTDAEETKESTTEETAEETSSQTNDAAEQHDEQYGVNDAISMFKEQFPQGEITKLSYENDDRYQYEVVGREGNNEHSLELNAVNGETKVKTENEDDEVNPIDQQYLDRIDQMLNKALDDFATEFDAKNMLAKKWDLEYDDGKLEFKTEVVSGNKSKEYKFDVKEEF